MARFLVLAGVVLILAGLVIRAGLPIGRLPGDLVIRRGGATFYLPIVTCFVISLLLSLIGMLFRR